MARGARVRYAWFMDAPRVLISRQRIAQRVEELGRQVTRDLAPALADDPTQRIVLMPILTGR